MYPQVQYEYARRLLEEKNWDLGAAINAHIASQQITIKFIDKKTNAQKTTHSFNKSDGGMQLIYHLTSIAPIREGAEFYNLHTGPNGRTPLTYEQLS